MSNKPVLCIQVNEETQLRLLEDRHIEDYFALIEPNKAYLHAWIDYAESCDLPCDQQPA